MRLTTYFLEHPVIALILNAMLVVIGLLCFYTLSLREYPAVQFAEVSILTRYPNASAELVESSVTNILEDQLAGIEGVETLTSNSRHGVSSIYVTFQNGVSMDRALIAVREAIGLARAQLPQEVKESIVERKTTSEGMPFILLSLTSKSMDFGALTHYAKLHLKNALRSIKGVAAVEVWGPPYTYEITLDPNKLYAFGVNTDQVLDALHISNLSMPVGKFQNEVPATLNASLKEISDYENLLVKENGRVFLRDIANIALRTDNQLFRVRVNGKPGVGIAIDRTNDGNPLEISTLVHKKVEELKQHLSGDLDINIMLDQADFVRASLSNIRASIVEAIVFVLLIVFLFLRNIKATLVPLVTIPISLIGAFIFLKVFGFSLNIMTLMAMVLAVGLVVDDAIVVLENIQRHIDEGISPFAAALKGSKEIGFAIIAMTLTLASVYAPLAFISGAVGQLFAEFAVALSGSVFISGVVALTLSPMMCAKTLSKNDHPMWPRIDQYWEKIFHQYAQILSRLIHHRKWCVVVMLGVLGVIFIFVQLIPRETAPREDRGLVGVYFPSIPGKNIETVDEKTKEIERILKAVPEVKIILTSMGNWGGSLLLPLKPLSERKRSAAEVVEEMRPLMEALPSIEVYPWSWDSGLPGVDDARQGSELSLAISSTDSYRRLFEQLEKAREAIDQEKIFRGVRHELKLDTPGYRIDLDTNEMSHLGLTAHQIAKTIEVFFSGDRSQVFSKDGLLYYLTVQGVPSPWSLNSLYITNHLGAQISLGAVAKMEHVAQPERLYHHNQMRSAILTVDLPEGEKLEGAMQKFLEAANKHLPENYKKTWVGAAKIYQESQTTMVVLFLLALIFIFAILAVQFENFIDPLIILFTVPLACAGALLFVWVFGQTLNIYTQVGLITLVGLITKHGILIVAFANQLIQKNVPLLDAILQAASLRLRPILMTTGAMVFGAIPLIMSHNAGYEARHAIGAVLIGGLTLGTVFTLFVLPTLYYMVKKYVVTHYPDRV